MIKRTKGAGRLSVSPAISRQYFGGRGTAQTQVGNAPINVNFGGGVSPQMTPVGSVQVGSGLSENRGSTTYNANVGIGASGAVQSGRVSGQVGPYVGVGASSRHGSETYNAGVGYSTTGPYAGVGATTTHGDVTYGVGAGYSGGGMSVIPTVQFGQSEASNKGAAYGGMAGSAIGMYFGGPLGAAAGSLIGSAVGSAIGGATGGGRNRKEHDARNNTIRALDDSGFWDKETRLATNPDGSTFDFSQTGKGGEHGWANVERRHSDHSNRDNLFSYDTDYTNDLDYVSNMAGSTLSRLLMGKTNKAADQFGGQLGNAFLGKSGYGAQMTKETFENTMNNARSYYAKAGIGTKEDLLGLANKLYADGQIKDVDYAVMQQTAGMLYDNDFATAQKLMAGRDKGIAEAAKTPSGGRAKSATPEQVGEGAGQSVPTQKVGEGAGQSVPTQKGRVWQSTPQDRIISAEEAWAQTRPFFDMYRAEYGSPGAGGMSGTNKGASVMSALQGANKLTSAITGRSALDWARAAYESLNSNNEGYTSIRNTYDDTVPLEEMQLEEYNLSDAYGDTAYQADSGYVPQDYQLEEVNVSSPYAEDTSYVPEDYQLDSDYGWGN